MKHKLFTILTACALAAAVLLPQAAVLAEKMVYPGDYTTNGILNVKTDFGAKGDGVTDDSDAIETAMNSKDSMDVFFPAGTYRVTRPISYRYKRNMFHGEEMSKTIIKLDDNCAAFAGSEYKALLYPNEEDNKDTFIFDAFMLGMYNMTIDIGAGNPNATAIKFTCNNEGGMRDVTIRSSDPEHKGGIGIDLTRQWPGPGLLKNVTIEGFDYGMRTFHTEYGMTMENIRLKNQRICGIYNERNQLQIQQLASINKVPAITSTGDQAVITLIDGEFAGGGEGVAALEIAQGSFYGRNLKKYGYEALLADRVNAKTVRDDTIKEYVNAKVHTLFDSPQRSLMLPWTKAPVVDYGPPEEWANVVDFGANPNDQQDDSAGIQKAIDSGAEVIYLPRIEKQDLEGYYIGDTVYIRGNVKAIVGCVSKFHAINGMEKGDKPLFKFVDGEAENVTMENFWFHKNVGDAWLFDIDTKRNVQLRNVLSSAWGGAEIKKPDVTATGEGILFLEDVCFGGLYIKDKIVLATQLNIEEATHPEGLPAKIINDGGQLRVLGYKTEKYGCVLKTINGGKSEILGGLIYPVNACDPRDAMIQTIDSATSVTLGSNSYDTGKTYETIFSETRNGETKVIRRQELPGRTGAGNMVSLYSGYTPELLADVKIPTPVTQPTEEDFNWESGSFEYRFRSGYKPKEDGSVRVVVNDVEVYMDVAPEIVNGRTMVPLRPIFTALDASVSWEEETKTVTAVRGDTTVRIQADSATAYINDEPQTLEETAVIRDGRVLVPLRFSGESFGLKVEWDDEAKTAVITK